MKANNIAAALVEFNRRQLEANRGADWLAMGPADFGPEAPPVQLSLFGAELPGPEELPGRGSLLAGGA